MAHHTLAPWGEVVPGIDRPMTVDELLRLPDDGYMYELVEGRLIRMAPGGGEASVVGADLLVAVYTFAREQELGRVTGPDGTYVLSAPGEPTTALVPDVAFVRTDRLPPKGTRA